MSAYMSRSNGPSAGFALTPVTDRNIQRLGVFTGERHDLADHLRRERRRRTTAGGIAQTRRDPGGRRRIAPPAPPVTDRLAPNPQLPCGLLDAQAGSGQQDDPSSFRQLLWR